ncbi:30S ribosomal protein S20 [Candidatus Parcubacteria bacterium]|nr:30S ribosomal protein S20 [Candidatus Parcubacteria bacterium]
MPITSSAKKALRNSARKRVFNMRKKDAVQGVMKKFKKLVAEGNKKDAQKHMAQIQKTLDKAAKTGLIKKNTASRKKARLSAVIKKMA